MEQGCFGVCKDGRKTKWLEIENEFLKVKVSDYGATLVELIYKPCQRDVVFGFDQVEGYIDQVKYMGAIVGRVCNRIEAAKFMLDDKTYPLYPNNHGNTLHGGQEGFDAKIWNIEKHLEHEVQFTLTSPSMEEGFPGNLQVRVTYRLEGKKLVLHYLAQSDADTPVSLTNHAFFNLSSSTNPTLKHHWVSCDADEIGLIDTAGQTQQETLNVTNTPFDLREGKWISEILSSHHEQIQLAKGLDHNFVLQGEGLRKVAVLKNEDLVMKVWTDMPDMHIYTGNFLANELGKAQACYAAQSAICFETQFYPNAINDPKRRDSVILKKHQHYDHITCFELDEQGE